MFLNTNRTNLTNYYSCYSCSYNYTWIRDKTRYLLFKYWEESIQICFYAKLISQKNAFLLPSPHTPFLTQESLFCHQREPLFFKSGKSDIFCSKKFAMSLIRTIFAFENGRGMANLGFVFTECLHSAFALPSLWVRSAFAPEGGVKASPKRVEEEIKKSGSPERLPDWWGF